MHLICDSRVTPSTLSTSLETVLLAVLLALAVPPSRSRPPHPPPRLAAVAAVTVLGAFNRPTFVLLAVRQLYCVLSRLFSHSLSATLSGMFTCIGYIPLLAHALLTCRPRPCCMPSHLQRPRGLTSSRGWSTRCNQSCYCTPPHTHTHKHLFFPFPASRFKP